MTPENLGRQKRDGTHPPVGLPDVRSPGARHSVILVADDDALIRNLVTLLLQQDGHFVLSAADGHEGLELSRHYPGTIDLIITDAKMPRLNGTDLCGHLLEERPGIKLLVMSGADMSEVARQSINVPFLYKPFDGETLRAQVRTILAAPRRHLDLTNLLSDLHAELKQIDREILSLEHSARANNKTAPRFVTDDPDAVS